MDDARAESPYTQRVLAQLRAWPTVAVTDAECGSGPALRTGSGEIAHLHGGDEAEVRLGAEAVGRMKAALDQTGRVKLRAETVRVRLQSDNDVRLLLSLLSVAIKESSRARPGGNGPWCRHGRIARSA
ncbi:luciferase family protein [Actinocorallia longicatena]|uniref:Luciferase domain-containing protein n=1 Tax=Actinocorallia longicatena TaxID=111803 RepID=A0ABP6Q3M1_9ACTN